MSTQIAQRNNPALPAFQMDEKELMQVLSSSLYPGAAEPSIKMVIGYCRAAGLDPMQKPVHIVPMWDSKAGCMRDVIMPGVGLYRTQAARSGDMAGISEPEFGPMIREVVGGQEIEYPEWCKVTVSRALPGGQIAEFTAREFWKENYAVKGGKEKSVAPNAMWTKRPRGQIAKCAQAQALRMAFPEMTGSAPTADEMEGSSLDAEATVIDGKTGEIIQAKPEKAAYPQASIDANREAWAALIASGKKTPAQIIAMIESKATLTEEQKNQIDALRVEQEQAA